MRSVERDQPFVRVGNDYRFRRFRAAAECVEVSGAGQSRLN
jgi:hypothetical protein